MLNYIKSAAKLVIRPKQFAREQNYDHRIKFHRLFKWLNSGHTAERVQLLKELQPSNNLLAIPEHSGFRKINDFDQEIIRNVHAFAREQIKKLDLKKLTAESETKHLVSIRLCPDANPDSPLMQMALHPAILKMVGTYLGMLPVIEDIWLWYSPNSENFDRSSQYYHLDGQDVRTLQMLFLVEDVDDDTGPFVFLEATESERFAREFNYKKSGYTKRINDELLNTPANAEKIHKIVGPAGSLFIADTDRCFHYGSRKASKPRFIITFQYFSPFAFSIPFKWWQGLPFANSPHLKKYSKLQRLALGAKN